MEVGNVKAALRMITECSNTGALPLHSVQPDGLTVKEHLMDKHLARSEPCSAAILEASNVSEPHPVMFDAIDRTLIRSVVLWTSGSASGLDSSGWRRMCSSFGTASNDLCSAVARLTRLISMDYVYPKGLTACLPAAWLRWINVPVCDP